MANQQLISLQNSQYTDLFPSAATQQDMLAWFNGAIPPNPIAAVCPTTDMYIFNPNQLYSPATIGAFAVPWNPSQEMTTIRERTGFLAHLGDVADFDEHQNLRGVAAQVANDAMQNGVPVPTHWAYNIGNTRGTKPPDTNKTWQQHVGAFVKKACSDSRGEMIRTAKVVWSHINPQPNSPWHTHAQVPGRLVKIFLYYLNAAVLLKPGRIKWLLGGRVRSHFDTNALYTAFTNNIPHVVLNPTTNQLTDLVPILKDWVEVVVAHVLTECFKNHYLVPASRESKDMLANNLVEIARRYQNRAVLEANIHEFPYM